MKQRAFYILLVLGLLLTACAAPGDPGAGHTGAGHAGAADLHARTGV